MNDKWEGLKDYLAQRLMRLVIYGFSIVLFVTLFILHYKKIEANEEFVFADFAVIVALTAAIIVIGTLLWQIAGKNKAQEMREPGKETSYQLNLKEYSEAVDKTEGRRTDLGVFCKEKTEEERAEKKRSYCAKFNIDYDKYEAEYIALDYQQLVDAGLTDKQAKAVLRGKQKRWRVRPIDPTELTTDAPAKRKYDVHYNEKLDHSVRVLIKIARAILTGILFYAVKIIDNENPDSAMFFLMLSALASSMLFGYFDGYNMIAITKKNVLKRRTAFLELFFEWHAKARPKEPEHNVNQIETIYSI